MYTYPRGPRFIFVKIFCHVNNKPAVIVGYGPGRKGRIRAIVISEGKMKDVALRDVVLGEHDKEMPNNVENIRRKSA